MEVRLEQEENAPSPMLRSCSGSVTDSKFEHPPKAEVPMVVRLSGRLTVFSFWQPLKALSLTVVIHLGIVMEIKSF